MSQTGSQMSHEDMLRELELLPVWQLKQPLLMPSKIEIQATDKSELVVTEQAAKEQEQEPQAAELPVVEIALAGSTVLESESSVTKLTPSAPAVLEILVPQQVELVESIEAAAAQATILEMLPVLRMLLSEDSRYAFLIEPYVAVSDVQQIETLLKNMIRAMQVSCRMDVTDSADEIFAAHTPKLIISLGAEPANQLTGQTYTLDHWRHIQEESPQSYEHIPLIVTYHPAHLLANTADKALAWRDLCAAIMLVQNL